jgi:hypothetical protein
LGLTFATVWSLSPASTTKSNTVLGVYISSNPFDVLNEDTYEQTNYIGSSNSFSADYTFALASDPSVREYQIVRLSNNSATTRKYAIAVVIPDNEIQSFKISGKVNNTEYSIYDPAVDRKLNDLVVSLQPNTDAIFKLLINRYSESTLTELHANINLQVLGN